MATTPENKLIGPPMRLNYPRLFVPTDHRTKKEKILDPQGKPKLKCSATLIVDEVSLAYPEFKPLWTKIVTAVRQAALDNKEIRSRAGAFLTKKLFGMQDRDGEICSDGGVRSPFKDGAKYVLTDADGKVTGYKPGYGPTKVIIDVSSFKPFPCVDRKAGADGMPLPITDPAKLYSGCYVRASFRTRVYTSGSYGVALDAKGFQFFQDGERLDDSQMSDDEFGPLDAAEAGDIGGVFAGISG